MDLEYAEQREKKRHGKEVRLGFLTPRGEFGNRANRSSSFAAPEFGERSSRIHERKKSSNDRIRDSKRILIESTEEILRSHSKNNLAGDERFPPPKNKSSTALREGSRHSKKHSTDSTNQRTSNNSNALLNKNSEEHLGGTTSEYSLPPENEHMKQLNCSERGREGEDDDEIESCSSRIRVPRLDLGIFDSDLVTTSTTPPMDIPPKSSARGTSNQNEPKEGPKKAVQLEANHKREDSNSRSSHSAFEEKRTKRMSLNLSSWKFTFGFGGSSGSSGGHSSPTKQHYLPLGTIAENPTETTASIDPVTGFIVNNGAMNSVSNTTSDGLLNKNNSDGTASPFSTSPQSSWSRFESDTMSVEKMKRSEKSHLKKREKDEQSRREKEAKKKEKEDAGWLVVLRKRRILYFMDFF